MANKFISNLTSSSSDIKKTRATIISKNAEAAQADVVRVKQQELRDLEAKKLELSDLYPESEFSLMVTAKDFNAKAWAESLQNLNIQILNKSVEVKLAEDTYNEWFSEEVLDVNDLS